MKETRMGRSNQLVSPTEVLAELSEFKKIVANEARLASERVGCPVDPHSPEIQARVAEIMLEVLRPFVAGGDRTPPNQEEAAERLGVPIATLRTGLSRLRQRYRETLRREVANTVSDPAEVDEELHYLYQILMT
jgi:hypothetical protein